MTVNLGSLPNRVLYILSKEGPLGVCRAVLRKVVGLLSRSKVNTESEISAKILAKYTPSTEVLNRYREEFQTFEFKPLISVLLPVYNTEPRLLKECIESVLSQVYPSLELCIADDGSTNSETRALLEQYQNNSKIKIVFRSTNGHIAEASNSALSLCTGEFVALLDHDDLLAPHALFCVVRELNRDRSLDLIYSNEDKIDYFGTRSQPTFKCGWSPEYFRSFMYVGHLSVIRTECINKVGGFRKGFEGSQDYDLMLRVSELGVKVAHIPEILYHWRMIEGSVALNIHAKPYAFLVAKKALDQHAARLGIALRTKDCKAPGIYQPELDSLEDANLVFLVEGDNSRLDQIKSVVSILKVNQGNIRFVSTQNRRASLVDLIKQHRSEIVVSIASAIQLPSKEALEVLLTNLLWPGVGIVGGALVSESDMKILHAGYVLERGEVFNRFFGAKAAEYGYGARLIAAHNVSAVSSSFFALKVSEFNTNDGLYEWESPESFNIALSIDAAKRGIRTVFVPQVRLQVSERLFESAKQQLPSKDLERLRAAFQFENLVDSYYPVGLNREKFDFSME